MLVRQNGNPTYFAADIAYHRNKIEKRGYDLCIDVWGADHHGHVARLKGALDAIGLSGKQLDVVLMQLVKLTRDGQVVRMSKRTGKAIQLADLLDEVPVDAARFLFNMREPNSQMEFDLDLAVQQDSQNPVYYVQYANARICSILRNLEGDGIAPRACTDSELALLTAPEELELIRHLSSFTEEIVQAAKDYDPARINRYVITLATLFHKFYNTCRVRGEEESLTAMVSEIEKQKMLSYEETIEKQKAQMQYLQLQLKPHFYLNGLKTLNALTLARDWEKSQELILHISEHLRYLLQTDRELVTLGAELNYVRNYVELQKSMTGRPVVCEIQEEEGAADFLVPTLCVQTFVENSVKYAKLGAPGLELFIQVCVQLLQTEDGVYVDIMVSDNGSGYPENILEEINADAQKGIRSVGINNLKRRCALIYEGKAEYNFYNGSGAVSELILPGVNPGGLEVRGKADERIDS